MSDMEIGNMLFGNSRGEYSVTGNGTMQGALVKLFCAIDDEVYFYGVEYENETFFTMPYWWGDCTCGWDFIDNGHSKLEALSHRECCYQNEYRFLMPDKGLRKLLSKHGFLRDIPEWRAGSALHCDCDYGEREGEIINSYAKEFGHMGHLDTCKLVMPNFWHKPSGYQLSWYKYPLRDSYANAKISENEFLSIIDDCIGSLK